MKVSRSRATASAGLALIPLFLSQMVLAQNTPVLEPVVVTSSRFEPDEQLPAIGASVITDREIREAGAASVVDALTRIGGVVTRNGGGAERSIDLRGFASLSSDNNIVVMVDGVRLSENEQTAAVLSSIPIDNVERIEIIRGGSSVLYGDGATGGVIRVITKRPVTNKGWGTVSAAIGSFNTTDLRASAGRDWNGLSIDASLQKEKSDGWRDNSATSRENFTGTLQYRVDGGRIGLRVDRSEQDTRLPGPLSLAQFEANPRRSVNPDDFGVSELTRYTLFGERRVGEWEAAFDLAQREKTVRSNFVSFASDQTDRSRVVQFSPRLRHVRSAGQVRNELSVGVDIQQWSRATSRISAFAPSAAQADQDAVALYLRDDLRVGPWRLTAGARQESFKKDFRDPLGAVSGAASAYQIKQTLRAWDLQAAYTLQKGLEVFAKAGQSYRLPNADDNGVTATTNQPLQPQTSHDLELGVEAGNQRERLVVKLFQHKLRNELLFNPAVGVFGGANDNIPASRRRGVEVEGKLALPASTFLSARWQYVDATITDGPAAGNALVLVPHNTVNLRLNWLPSGPHSASTGLVWVSSQRFSGDFNNSCAAQVPGYATLDARYAWKHNGWEVSLLGTNLTDRRYYSYATVFNCGASVYPENARAFTLRVRRDF